MGDRTETFDADDFGVSPSGKSFVTLRGIKATEFDETVTASFKLNGSPIGRTVSYSVNTYISGVQDYSDATVAALAQALYNYGASAAAYSTQ